MSVGAIATRSFPCGPGPTGGLRLLLAKLLAASTLLVIDAPAHQTEWRDFLGKSLNCRLRRKNGNQFRKAPASLGP